MRVVIGTAGHIDHGKTTLLRALTGIDADRLPEEQRRGMTIDVGYAYLDAPDGGKGIDFVDVPGHDRLVGNMLVGAGEIDAALLVVAADDGPRPQTIEHVELLDALGIEHAVVAVTKADLVSETRLADVRATAGELVKAARFGDAPVIGVSAATGAGIDELHAALVALAGRIDPFDGPTRLAIDRVFARRGRGTVVTGSLRGGPVARNTTVRLMPGDREARIREVQVHGTAVAHATGGGRVALNLAGVDIDDVRRGDVLAEPGALTGTRRLLVALEPACDLERGVRRRLPDHGERVRLHLGTDQVEVAIVRNGRLAADLPGGGATAVLRLERPVAAGFGDRFVLRRPSPGTAAAGGRILDPLPPLGVSRRRATPAALAAVAAIARAVADAGPIAPAVADGGAPVPPVANGGPGGGRRHRGNATPSPDALVALWGAVRADRLPATPVATAAAAATDAADAAPSAGRRLGPLVVDGSVCAELESVAIEAAAQSVAVSSLRQAVARALRRAATVDVEDAARAAEALVEDLVRRGLLVRAGDRIGLPGRSEPLPPHVVEAMDRVEAALSVPAPPPFSEVVRASGCPPEGLRALAASDRIVRLEPEIAYAKATYARLAGLALQLAARTPLTPAAFRDATGTSRKYALAILEDLDRRGLLARTADGHIPGPRAPTSR
jgi:selenocysteine-specific elongation factor